MKEIKIKATKYGTINPNETKGWFFPNWFSKSNIEEVWHKKLNGKQFEAIKEFLMEESDIGDAVSKIVREYLTDSGNLAEDIKRILRENK